MELDIFDQLGNKVNRALETISRLREENKKLIHSQQVLESKVKSLEEEIEKLRLENQRIRDEQAADFQKREEVIKERLKGMLEKLEAMGD